MRGRKGHICWYKLKCLRTRRVAAYENRINLVRFRARRLVISMMKEVENPGLAAKALPGMRKGRVIGSIAADGADPEEDLQRCSRLKIESDCERGAQAVDEMSRNRRSRQTAAWAIWLKSTPTRMNPTALKGLTADGVAGLLSQLRSRGACYVMKRQVLLATGREGD
jgi:hypothetical protein